MKNIILAIIGMVTFLFLQLINGYHFFYIEQTQLFQTTSFYFFNLISHPGGLIEYISYFLVQFFNVPFLGAFISSILLVLIYLASSKLLYKATNHKLFFVVPASLYSVYLLSFFDINIFYQHIISFLLCIWLLMPIVALHNKFVKNILVFVLIPLVFWFAGSVSLLFAIAFGLNEIIYNKKSCNRFFWLLFPLWAVVVAWLSYRFSFIGNLKNALLPNMYYQDMLKPSFLIYVPWILLLFWMEVFALLPEINIYGRKRNWIIVSQCLIIVFLLGAGITKFGDRPSYLVKKLDYYARMEQWDKIISVSKKAVIHNFLHLNYLNLALAEKGLLLDKMFLFNQKGAYSLSIPNQKKNFISAVSSDINFCAGNIATAQQYAFEGYETSSGGGSGRLLKRMVQTNLIFSEYKVAEKYISLLENTFFYRKWALAHRKFLYNDSLCLQDSLFGSKIKCLPNAGSRYYTTGGPETLNLLTTINADNKTAQEYFFAYLLLTKNLKLFLNYFLKNNADGNLTAPMPEYLQQAIMMCYETQPKKWDELAISEKNVQSYRNYRLTYFQNERNPKLQEIMQQSFGKTYWYYFQFISIK